MPPNCGKLTNYQTASLFCFMEGISMIVKFQQVKFLQIEGDLLHNPKKQLKRNSRNSSFWATKCFKMKGRDLNFLKGTWYQIWLTQKFRIDQKVIKRRLVRSRFKFRSANNSVNFRWFAFEEWILLMQILILSKKTEISGFGTFISKCFISSKKCPILMVDTALNSWESEVFNTAFDVITTLLPAALQ